ncbi:MAG: hypothetical protein OXC92_04210 [Flavobacteriaceae bacterium]|nr:hypothetical protein [Flavobacteriaceae bacterium]
MPSSPQEKSSSNTESNPLEALWETKRIMSGLVEKAMDDVVRMSLLGHHGGAKIR